MWLLKNLKWHLWFTSDCYRTVLFSAHPLSLLDNISLSPRRWKWVPLKLSSPAEFMINLSIQNFILLLVVSLFPSGLGSIKHKGETETKHDTVGSSQGQKPLWVPNFLFVKMKGFNLLGFPLWRCLPAIVWKLVLPLPFLLSHEDLCQGWQALVLIVWTS